MKFLSHNERRLAAVEWCLQTNLEVPKLKQSLAKLCLFLT